MSAAHDEPLSTSRLGIRAQLLLVLTVFLAMPWLGYEYVRELERFLRDAQERRSAGTAQAVATALHDRPRLFDAGAARESPIAAQRALDGAPAANVAAEPARRAVPAVARRRRSGRSSRGCRAPPRASG